MLRLSVAERLGMSVQLATLAYPFVETFALVLGWFLLVFFAVIVIALFAK